MVVVGWIWDHVVEHKLKNEIRSEIVMAWSRQMPDWCTHITTTIIVAVNIWLGFSSQLNFQPGADVINKLCAGYSYQIEK